MDETSFYFTALTFHTAKNYRNYGFYFLEICFKHVNNKVHSIGHIKWRVIMTTMATTTKMIKVQKC